MMVKIVEILQQKGIDHKTLLIVSCSIYSFLIWVSETSQRVFFKISLDIWCSKLLNYFSKKRGITRCLVLFLVPYIRYLFESLKLIKQFLQDSTRYLDAQTCWNISTFFKKFYPAQSFSCSTSMFLIFLPCNKGVSFLEQNQLFQLLKMVEILHQNFNFEIVCSIIVPQWRRKKLLFI